MNTLSDQIDRLARNTRSIRTIAGQTAVFSGKISSLGPSAAGTFTRAVLHTDLGDLIRDIDPSELGLFSLLTRPEDYSRDKDDKNIPPGEIARVQFSGVTPLRKGTTRYDDGAMRKEIEPEVYAEASLKYIDRYQPIRPMPRAYSQVNDILERLKIVRGNIQHLSGALKQTQAGDHHDRTSKSFIEDEEKRIQDLKLRFSELTRRKQAATSRQRTSRTTPSVPEQKKDLSFASAHEDSFWNDPATAAKTLRFTDNLMNENIDLGDVTTTPLYMTLSPTGNQDSFIMEDGLSQVLPEMPVQSDTMASHDDSYNYRDSEDEGPNDTINANEGERVSVVEEPLWTESLPNHHDTTDTLISPPSSSEKYNTEETKIRINSEVERIVARIWTTAGDIIMPGHPFGVSSGNATQNKPPQAKETIAHLQSLSTLSPFPDSPSTSSVSSVSALPPTPTTQQILTAYLLLCLLRSPSHFTMPLSKVKDLLASKANSWTYIGSSQNTTRVLYGCVAKRLVKIERGGGEQIVKFDI